MCGAGAERVVCQVSVKKKTASSVDDVVYKVKLTMAVQCPPASVILVAPPSEGLDISSVEVLSRLGNGPLVWKPLLSFNTVLLAETVVPRCLTVTDSLLRNIEFEMVFDNRITNRLPSDSRVRFLFESICKEEKKGAIVTRFYSQSLDVHNIQR